MKLRANTWNLKGEILLTLLQIRRPNSNLKVRFEQNWKKSFVMLQRITVLIINNKEAAPGAE